MNTKEPLISPNIAVYIRISSRELNNESLSIQNQESKCRQAGCDLPGVVAPEFTVYRDEHYSGKLSYQRDGTKKFRPALTQLVNAIEEGKHEVLLVYRFDRLSRNLRLWAELVELAYAHGVRMISVCEPFDVNSIEGRMASGMLANVAEFYVNWTAQNIRDTLAFKKKEGYRVGAPPFGWKWSDARQDGHKLVERDEREGEVVVRICDMIRSGWNFTRVCKELESQGIKSPSGGKTWWRSVVKRVAREPFSAGLVYQEDGGLKEGRHYDLRYFDREYHELVVAQVRKLERVAPITRWSETHLLMPKLKCASCGARLYVDKREDSRHRVYWCKNHSIGQGQTCTGARAKIAWADAAVVEVIRKLASDPRVAAQAEEFIAAEVEPDYGKLKQEKAKLERDLREDSQRLADIVERLADGRVKPLAYEAFEQRVEARGEERVCRIREIDAALADSEATKRRTEQVTKTLQEFDATWDSLKVDEQRQVIDLLVDDLTLSATHLTIKPCFAEAVAIRIPPGRFREGKPGDPCGLSQRELSVLKLLGDGLNNTEIAERTGLKIQTVYGIISRIRGWMGISDIALIVEEAQEAVGSCGASLPTDRRLGAARLVPDEPTLKQLEVLRAVATHGTQAEAYRALGIPYINGSMRLRALLKKANAGSLDELFQIACDRGWIDQMPTPPKVSGVAFTPPEAQMMRACTEHKTVAAAGRALDLSRVAANSRMHTIYQRLGVRGLDAARAKMLELGLDPRELPVHDAAA